MLYKEGSDNMNNPSSDGGHVKTGRNTMHDGSDLNNLMVLPLKHMVAFPRLRLPLAVSGQWVEKYENRLRDGEMIGLVALKDENISDPRPEHMFETGTIAEIIHSKKAEDGTVLVIVDGKDRFRITDWLSDSLPFTARAVKSPEVSADDLEQVALERHVRSLSKEVISLSPQLSDDINNALSQLNDPLQLAYVLALNSELDIAWRQSFLEMDSVKEKLRAMATHLAREKEILTIGNQIQTEARSSIDKSQREYYLRQQLKAIQNELGEGDPQFAEADEYAERIESSGMTAEARRHARRELARFSQMSPQSPEHPLVKAYLDWLLDLPWHAAGDELSDIAGAREILEADHFGLSEVKERLVEFLAVRNLKLARRDDTEDPASAGSASGVILCLVGPPGVGKTSLGRSVARALGRAFTRMSLGGMRDEAEIRGHRRTYIGAMPGRIIQAIKRAGTRNPVFMLDEIDKVGQDWRGDPSSALLEVLDPAQNSTFRDHYLDVDFDLSQVIFIATANQLGTIPPPLRDRMEIIQIDGYTDFEKVQIAKRHLIPRQLKAHGLEVDEVTFMDDAVSKIVQDYTREAGVRSLERQIAAVCRKAIMQLTGSGWPHVVITPEVMRDYLKKERFESERAEPIEIPGIVHGLAVTPVGGEILTIEATRMPGKGGLTLTGQLGDVMKESARIALSYVRSQAQALQIDPVVFDSADVHLHVPAGALPKDGPSAGVAMVSALASLFTNRAAKSMLGISGEVTLRGRILPVGGIKMKVLAAHRAGLKTVVLPKRNERDLDDIPEEVRHAMQFVLVEHIHEAIEAVFAAGYGDGTDPPCGPVEIYHNNGSPALASFRNN
jgi:ATP-dependent Lon protease